MSKVIKNTGRKKTDMIISEFYGGEDGIMLQISQGLGMDLNEPGFIQLTKKDAKLLQKAIESWLLVDTAKNPF